MVEQRETVKALFPSFMEIYQSSKGPENVGSSFGPGYMLWEIVSNVHAL